MSRNNVTEYDMNTERKLKKLILLRKKIQFQKLTRRDAVQVVLYYNNNKEIKGEKKHLGNSVYSIEGSHHFVEVEICKCNEKGRKKVFIKYFLSSNSCLRCCDEHFLYFIIISSKEIFFKSIRNQKRLKQIFQIILHKKLRSVGVGPTIRHRQ